MSARTGITQGKLAGLWSGLLVGVTLTLSFSLPLEQMAHHADMHHPLLLLFRWAGQLAFAIDLFLRSRRGDYAPEGTGRNWLPIDLLAALPLGPLAYVFWGDGPSWPLSLLHLLPILRLARVYVSARDWQQANPSRTGIRRIVTTVTAIAMLIHWIGCWQMAVYTSDQAAPFMTRYLQALYWTTTTMTTIGYGDITPDKTRATELMFTMTIMLLGAGVFGYVIGNIATIMANIDFARNQHLDRMQRITAFMRYNKIPPELGERVNQYYSHLWQTRKGFDEASILADLPPSLRGEVEMHLRRDIVSKVPFFRGANNQMLHAIVTRLRPRIAFPGEYVIRRGELGDCMYFIAAGSVEVLGQDGQAIATLTDGGFFGETALIEQRVRGADVRASGFCDLYTLAKSSLEEVMTAYPEFGKHIRDISLARSVQPA